MAEPIRITVDDKAVQAALQQLLARSSDLTRPMADIGEHLTETTKRRFATSTGPDGERWARGRASGRAARVRFRGVVR